MQILFDEQARALSELPLLQEVLGLVRSVGNTRQMLEDIQNEFKSHTFLIKHQRVETSIM